MKVLFVCSQNMCRSPYCEYMFRRMVSESPILKGKVEVKSSAVMSPVRRIHEKTAKALIKEGFTPQEVYAHKPGFILRPYDRKLFREADVIIGMTMSHKFFLPPKWKKKFLTLSQAAEGRYVPVPDPWLKGEEDYNKAMEFMKDYLKKYIAVLEEELK